MAGGWALPIPGYWLEHEVMVPYTPVLEVWLGRAV